MVTNAESTLKVIEPATEQVLAELPHAGVQETDAAVARARAAFPAWRAVSPGDLEAAAQAAPLAVFGNAGHWTAAPCRSTPTHRSGWRLHSGGSSNQASAASWARTRWTTTPN